MLIMHDTVALVMRFVIFLMLGTELVHYIVNREKGWLNTEKEAAGFRVRISTMIFAMSFLIY